MPARLSALLALCLSLPAAAIDADVSRAKDEFQQGHADYRAGRYAAAVRHFEAANAIKPHPIFLYDMAQAYRLAGDPAHALEMYRAYLDADPKAKNRAGVERKIALLREQITSATQTAGYGVIKESGKRKRGLVAVLELRSKLEGDERKAIDAAYLADVVRAAALSSGGVEVMTRENMLVLLKQAGRSPDDCEGECEVESGRKVGADLVVSGEILRFGSSYKVDLKLHATRTGKLLATALASGKTIDELDEQAQHAARKLLE